MNIIRSDTLEKETRALKRLKKRWVELDDDKLSFYELGLGTNVKGVLQDVILNHDIVKVEIVDKTVLLLTLRNKTQTRINCFITQRAEDWHKDISYRAYKKDK